MGTYKKEPFEQKMLEPLKRRPDLEPEAKFVSSLRNRLIEEEKKGSRFPKKKPMLIYFVVSVLAAGLFFMLALPYLPLFDDHASEQVKNKPSEKEENNQSMSFEEILSENEAYNTFYSTVSKALDGQGSPKTIIYYFDSLQSGDAERLEPYLFEGDLQSAQALIGHYEGMDHSSIVFENMLPGEDGASYDIYFTYLDAGENKNGSLQLIMADENNAYVYDLPEEEGGEAIHFKLTEEESEAYERFSSGHDREYLKGLTPISIAKLYIQAQLDSDYHTKYALYTSREDHQMWTLEEELENGEGDMLSTGALLDSLGWVQEGEFIVDDEISGHIEFTDEYGNVRGFNMIRDEDGMWKVAFLPIQ